MSYTAKQLVAYYRWCRDNPAGAVVPPGGRRDYDRMPAGEWLRWFRECLTRKIAAAEDRPAVRADDPDFRRALARVAGLANGRFVLRPRDLNGMPAKIKARLAHRVTQPWEE